jgi:hypothetical protein
MSPPTNIDNTTVQEVTIDGQDVDEITVDGDVVFSASLGVVAESSLNAWYRFEDGDARDYTNVFDVGNTTTFDGSISGGTVNSTGGGIDFKQGADSGSYDTQNGGIITVPEAVFDKSGPVSVVLVTRPRTNTSAERLLSTDASNNDSPRGIVLQEIDRQYGVFTSGTGGAQQFGTFNIGTLTQVGFIIDGTEIFGVFDGTKTRIATSSSGFGNQTNPFKIGGEDKRSNFYDGEIDEVRVYNKALSGTEVQDIFDNTVP